MSDLIDRQAAIDRFQALSYDDWNQGVSTSWANAYSECAEVIRDLPTIDAAQVVRCRDCVHNDLPPTAGNAKCSIYYGMTEVYGFCHRGERREVDD